MNKTDLNQPLFKVIRPILDGKAKYARIPIRNKYPEPRPEENELTKLILWTRKAGMLYSFIKKESHSEQTVEEFERVLKSAVAMADFIKDHCEVCFQEIERE